VNNTRFLSHILSASTPSYGNRDKFIVESKSDINLGDTANSSSWTFTNNHLGTHIDLPRHFCANGFTYEDYRPEDFIFNNVILVDYPCDKGVLIGRKELRDSLDGLSNELTDLLIIRTSYEVFREKDKYWNDNPGLHYELADYFRYIFPNIRAVGFDFISLTSWNYRQEGRLSHKAFLCPENKQPIWIIEDMSLKEVNHKIKKVIIAPLRIKNSNGGPVSIIAF